MADKIPKGKHLRNPKGVKYAINKENCLENSIYCIFKMTILMIAT